MILKAEIERLKEENKSMINQLLIKPIQPILNVKKEDE